MPCIAAKFMLRLMSEDQKEHWLPDIFWEEFKDLTRTDPNFLSKVITDDESWVYRYDLETNSSLHNGRVQHHHLSWLLSWLPRGLLWGWWKNVTPKVWFSIGTVQELLDYTFNNKKWRSDAWGWESIQL